MARARPTRATLLALALATGACVTPAATEPGDALARVTSLERHHLDKGITIPAVELLALSPEMRRFALEHASPPKRPLDRVRALHSALFGPDGLGIRYEPEHNHSARETFERRSGNCLSLASLFVALARAAGLDAHYQEVYVAPVWTERADLMLLQRHVNVVGRLHRDDAYSVDFLELDTSEISRTRIASDERALAQHYNNLAVEQLARGDHAAALAHAKRALQSDPTLALAWSNLGAIYRRAGEAAAAEAAYLEALALDPEDASPASNLAALYRSLGRDAEAQRYEALVRSYRLRNPYYRAQLAEAALAKGDLERAIREYRRALALEPGVERFQLGLAEALRLRDARARGVDGDRPDPTGALAAPTR